MHFGTYRDDPVIFPFFSFLQRETVLHDFLVENQIYITENTT